MTAYLPGCPVTLRGARSWHGIVVRTDERGYVVDFGGGEQSGFHESELMRDPTIPHAFVEGRMYGAGKCSYAGCGSVADHEVHDQMRVEIERQRQELDARRSGGEGNT